MADLVGKTFGAYRIEAVLSQGGTATVYRAFQTAVKRYVAIKVIAVDSAADPGFGGRFASNARVIARLQHPHILPIIDYGEAEGMLYLVMQYLEGGSLEDRIRRRALTLPEAGRYLDQIASALDYAHKRGLVHRDFTANNVLLDNEDNAYLTDFGIMRLAVSGTGLTAVGRLANMSPEQLTGRPLDGRTDVYALGVVTYEMVVRRLPFDADTPAALILQHLNEAPPLPSQINPQVPLEIENVILRALEKNPDSRYQTAGDMARDFTEALRSSDAKAEPAMERTVVGGPVAPVATAPTILPAPREADLSAADLKESNPQTDFTAFYPEQVRPGLRYALMAFAHLRSAYEAVKQVAAGYSSLLGNQPTDRTTRSKIHFEKGTLLTFVPFIGGVTFTPAEQFAVWQPPFQSVTFLFTCPEHLDSDLNGHIQVYMGPLIIGEIPITMKLAKPSGPAEPILSEQTAIQKYDPIFASYSHLDTPIMEYFRRARENIGQTMLVDIYDLRAGEYWSGRLLKMIDDSAVFQLFWSKNSARSKYCREEWEYALQYKDNRPRFIQPVWWSSPMPSPPSELADLHFQRIIPPPLTRLQLAAAQVRILLKRKAQ